MLPAPRALKSEEELCAWILKAAHKTADCADLDLKFTIVRRHSHAEDQPSWDVRAMKGWSAWPESCRAEFLAAVRVAQMRFDLLFGPTDAHPSFPGEGDE